MIKIKIFSISKTKEPWLIEAIAEYEKRLSSTIKIQWIFLKDNKSLEKALSAKQFLIVLDSPGKQMSSEAFSQFLNSSFAKEKSVAFVIGSADGLSSSIKQKADLLLSLSSLTFTHQFCRLLLLEQIYRAMEIAKGSCYHK